MPIGTPVGWWLPCWPGTSCSISTRAAWKSSMAISDSSSEVRTQLPSPVRSRRMTASRIPKAR